MHKIQPAVLPIAGPPEQQIPVPLVEQVVREEYGIEARAERLTGERDQNYRIRTAGGDGFVLKIAHAEEQSDIIDLPIAALLHIERIDPGLPCPRVVRINNRTRVTFRDPDDVERTAFLYTFLPGKTLLSSTRCQAQRSACGQLLARLGHALRNFQHPATKRTLIWDAKQIPALAGALCELASMRHYRFCAAFVRQFSGEILPHLQALRSQPVHNDFNARNLLVDPQDATRITGIIDFGDLVHTVLIADIAVGVVGQLDAAESAWDAMREFIEGYHAVEPLRPEEHRLLNWLIAGRIVQNATMTSWYRLHSPRDGHFDAFDDDYFQWRIEFAERLIKTEARLL